MKRYKFSLFIVSCITSKEKTVVESQVHRVCFFFQLQKMKSEISDASKDPSNLLMEAIHSAGYAGALANPLLAPESAVERLNASQLEEFVAVIFKN